MDMINFLSCTLHVLIYTAYCMVNVVLFYVHYNVRIHSSTTPTATCAASVRDCVIDAGFHRNILHYNTSGKTSNNNWLLCRSN